MLILPTAFGQAPAPSVVATSRPLHALASGVMQGVGKPILLSAKSLSHHGGELRPKQMMRLADASLLITMGQFVDAGVYKFAKANDIETISPDADNTHVLLKPRDVGVWDEDHTLVDGAASFTEHEIDIHIWLSPTNAISLTQDIAHRLGQIDNDNRSKYLTNAKAQIEKIQALDNELRIQLEPLKGKPFVSYHDATQYFEYHYGLRAIASIAAHDSHGTGAKTLRNVRQAIEKEDVQCFFREPGNEPKLVNAVVENFDTRISEFDPGGVVVTPGIDAWGQTMRNLANKFSDCLSQ